MPFKPDATDLKILEVMQTDASLSSAEMAERVGLSQSPCWRRIQRLRDEGFITRIVGILDKKRLGLNVQILAQAKLATLTDEERENFVKVIRSIPEIQECWLVLGESDVVFRILAPDVDWFQTFVSSVLVRMPGIHDVRSIVITTEIKSSTAVPLGERRPIPVKWI
jgi:Lrp/AsnC family transcriptional regulator